MWKAFNIIIGFFVGFLPSLVAILFSAMIFYYFSGSILGIIGILFLMIGSILIGISIFKKIQKVGVLEFISVVNASPELDNIELLPGSITKLQKKIKELVKLINEDDNLFKSGTIRIFGDWFGKPNNNKFKIISANYKEETQTLIIKFESKLFLEIINPKHIYEANSFLKIINADKITIKWYRSKNEKLSSKQYYIIYNRIGKSIKTKTNIDYYKPSFDVSFGASALLISN